MLKSFLAAAAAILITAPVMAQSYGYGTGSNPNNHGVSGYTRNDGTYVQPYHATNPNGTQRDNYSSSGNMNPYTGSTGHRTPRY
ncbi:hypothetical protein; putative secreted protein [Bradyrhizobium sp. ORS 278]|nr:hypothetical protein; putative secreted protein [Bradyrhizobium sp. ORS 278]